MPCSSNEPTLDDDEVSDEEEAEGLGIWDKCLADEEDVGEDDEDIFIF